MARKHEDRDRLSEAQRTTKDEARSEGVGGPGPGSELPARSYPDQTQVADLGVDEPTLGSTPRSDSSARPRSKPTGIFAGETEADRREEDAVRRMLEARFRRTRGAWKESGAVPSAAHDQPEED